MPQTHDELLDHLKNIHDQFCYTDPLTFNGYSFQYSPDFHQTLGVWASACSTLQSDSTVIFKEPSPSVKSFQTTAGNMVSIFVQLSNQVELNLVSYQQTFDAILNDTIVEYEDMDTFYFNAVSNAEYTPDYLPTLEDISDYIDALTLDEIPNGTTNKHLTSTNLTKLNGIASGATNTAAPVNADWNASSGLAQILNKPTIPTFTAGAHIADAATNAATNAVTNLATNYNLATGLLGIANALNDANTAQNDLATKYNALGVKYNDLAGKYNTLLDRLEALTLLATS